MHVLVMERERKKKKRAPHTLNMYQSVCVYVPHRISMANQQTVAWLTLTIQLHHQIVLCNLLCVCSRLFVWMNECEELILSIQIPAHGNFYCNWTLKKIPPKIVWASVSRGYIFGVIFIMTIYYRVFVCYYTIDQERIIHHFHRINQLDQAQSDGLCVWMPVNLHLWLDWVLQD